MTPLNELRVINDSTILYLQKIKRDCTKNNIMKDILNDEACFFKMEKGDAYMVLKDIGVMEQEVENIYKKLISPSEFHRLLYCKKIDLEDENVVIKYPVFGANSQVDELKKDSTNQEEVSQNSVIVQNKQPFFKRCINFLRNLFK